MKQKHNKHIPIKPCFSANKVWRKSRIDPISYSQMFKENWGFSTPEELHKHLQTFSGNFIEFVQYARDFNSDWTSFHPSDTYSPESLDLFIDFAYEQKKTLMNKVQFYEAEICVEYLYGENVCFGEFGYVISDDLEHEVSSEEPFHSRCEGKHSGYRRRCDKARQCKRKVHMCIPAIHAKNGSLSITMGYLCKKYLAAMEALRLEHELALNGLKIDYRTHETLISIVKKYKKMIKVATRYDFYYDGHYLVLKD